MTLVLPFADSRAGFAAIRYGDTASDGVVAHHGSASMRFNRPDGYARAPGTSLSYTGTGDFTAECWARVDNVSTEQGLFSLGGASSGSAYYPYLYVTDTGVLRVGEGTTSSIPGAGTVSAGTWFHAAITRASGTATLWLNGGSEGTATTVAEARPLDSLGLFLGASATGGGSSIQRYLLGNLHFRFTNGVARYTAPFTPPASFPVGAGDAEWENVTALFNGGLVVLQPALLEPPAPLITFAPTWPATPRVETDTFLLTRPDYGGYGRIAGDVMIKGTPDAPVRRIVRLVREIDAICVAQQWSDPITGAYEFLGFDPAQLYTVLAYDELGGYRAAIASNVVPEPMIV